MSAGGVVFDRSQKSPQICLIERHQKGKSLWCLPKGHVEQGESFEQAALREILEETGITGEIVKPLGQIAYSFFDLEVCKKVSKTVHFFSVRYLSGDLVSDDVEVIRAKWFPAGEVLEHLEYPGEREMFEKAAKITEEMK